MIMVLCLFFKERDNLLEIHTDEPEIYKLNKYVWELVQNSPGIGGGVVVDKHIEKARLPIIVLETHWWVNGSSLYYSLYFYINICLKYFVTNRLKKQKTVSGKLNYLPRTANSLYIFP